MSSTEAGNDNCETQEDDLMDPDNEFDTLHRETNKIANVINDDEQHLLDKYKQSALDLVMGIEFMCPPAALLFLKSYFPHVYFTCIQRTSIHEIRRCHRIFR